MASQRRERALELMKRVLDLRQELAEAEAELDKMFASAPRGGNQAKAAARPANVSAAPRPATPAAVGSGRGDLTNALRKALETANRDFTVDQVMEAAGVEESRRGSVYAALSRLVGAEKIAKGTAPGTYRAIRREQHG